MDLTTLTMQIDELRKELRHIKSRRDFYMKEVNRLQKEFSALNQVHIATYTEKCGLQMEIDRLKQALAEGNLLPKEDPGDGQM